MSGYNLVEASVWMALKSLEVNEAEMTSSLGS